MSASELSYAGLKALSKKLRRPVSTLYVLSLNNDPFYVSPGRETQARWAARVWELVGVDAGFHVRRIHYRLISQAEPVMRSDGQPYHNTLECYQQLGEGIRDAIALNLLPADVLSDHRNSKPRLHQLEAQEAAIEVDPGDVDDGEMEVPRLRRLWPPSLPSLSLNRPVVPQPYQIEICCEKSTADDVLVPLAQHYNVNLQTGVGELSATRCRELVTRAEAHGRPVRILYVSDFDPGGMSMPTAVSRKIEFELHRRQLELDIQVRPVVLTHEQCVEYGLPRSPIKESEARGGRFEARFGEGATELDALEALHPGLLRRILTTEIHRYWDPDHRDKIDETCERLDEEFDAITKEATRDPQLTALLAEFDGIKAKYDAWCERMEQTMREEHAAIAAEYEAWCKRAKPAWQAAQDWIEETAPDINHIEWAERFEPDEDPDPLFSSTRSYLDQIDRYKSHQGKPTARKEASERSLICEHCQRPFRTRRSHSVVRFCSKTCWRRHSRLRLGNGEAAP